MTDHRMLKGTEARLWSLIEQRTLAGADIKRIDQRIWDLFGEEWAIMFTDLAGFSRQAAAFGIVHFLQVIFEKKRLLLPVISDYDGILLKMEADSFLVIFRRPEMAVRCAVAMQRACRKASERRVAEEQILLCVGIGHGKVLRVGDREVWGAEVNAASKLGEDTAKAHEVLVTESVKDACEKVEDIQFLDLGVAVPGSAQNYRLKYRP
ncbi:MAG: adenylate/guanylate cyclase domain-containing protein [Myxococcota bacterium]